MRQTPKVLELQERARGPLSRRQVWWGSDFTRRRGGQKCQTVANWRQYYTVSQKKGATLTMAITLSILDRFAKFFHCCKQQ